MTPEGSRRIMLLGVALVVVAGVAVGDAVGSATVSTPQPIPASAMVAGSGASSSAWYCAGVAAAPGGTQASVLITNPASRHVGGTIDTVPVGSTTVAPQNFAVSPGQEIDDPVAAGASTVLVDGGGVGVEEELSGSLGSTVAPCASATSAHWYFAEGSTASGDVLHVALFNPLPSPAVVDVSFVSASAGVEEPPAYQGIPVAPGTVVTEDVTDHVPGDPALATEVDVLSGAVAAAEVSEMAGPGSGGLSLVDGESAPGSVWAFAQNADLPGGGNSFGILNPSSSSATVTVSIALAQGEAKPLTLRVPPQALVPLVTQDQTRIPIGSPFALTFSASHGSRIVVTRLASSSGTVTPAAGVSQGEPGGIRRWLVPPVAPGETPSGLAVVDLAGRPVTMTIDGLVDGRSSPITGERDVVVSPGSLHLVSFTTATPVGWAPMEVVADGPVAVELDPAPAGPPGTDTIPAWPLLSSG